MVPRPHARHLTTISTGGLKLSTLTHSQRLRVRPTVTLGNNHQPPAPVMLTLNWWGHFKWSQCKWNPPWAWQPWWMAQRLRLPGESPWESSRVMSNTSNMVSSITPCLASSLGRLRRARSAHPAAGCGNGGGKIDGTSSMVSLDTTFLPSKWLLPNLDGWPPPLESLSTRASRLEGSNG